MLKILIVASLIPKTIISDLKCSNGASKTYILKPSRPQNKSHGKERGPLSSVLLPKVVALYSVNTGKNEDIALISSSSC